ncbi:hypothetical protein [Rhizobium viscosum]|uniref:Uncharacterized protein n=1 Tax=Rhizobium viscosum TaxID=1673 RepID=A0ABR9IYL4_RHIVS|nr:hypothetical protein [Rhizobium viscosum]MBE1508289.1 hypothetical protein [Rhizobium viscosum]
MSKSGLRHFGLVHSPIAWALATQLGQVTPYIDCRQNVSWTAVSCGILLLISVGGIVASRMASTGTARTERFIVDGGFLLSSAFVFALLLQGAASMLLDPCQR